MVKSIHGDYGGIENIGSNYRSSTWLECLKSVDQLKKKGVDLMSFVHKEVGDGKDTLFWLDPWLEDVPLNCKFQEFMRWRRINKFRWVISLIWVSRPLLEDCLEEV